MELCSVLCGRLDGSGVWGRMDTCTSISICVAESLCCSPGTITILLISYTPIQNKFFKKRREEGRIERIKHMLPTIQFYLQYTRKGIQRKDQE